MSGSPAWRSHPLDGAMLYFDPATGTNVRVVARATRGMRRRAPRVVMFGVTNRCNLACAFCSRDTARESAWEVESAATFLEDLAGAGVLDVAFGGGEPFAFRGFEELLLRLRRSTALALNVTTNGTLLRDDVVARLAGVLGQVRLSIYGGVPWRPAAHALGRFGQLWGANLLVDDRSLGALPALLVELAALGAHDVSLLRYVGPDPSHVLSSAGERALAEIAASSPLPCRVSVCFGSRLDVPRLFDGADGAGDCGAGLDFLTVTPDRRVASCSFQDVSFPVASARDALAVWRTRRAALRRASPRRGCGRTAPAAGPDAPPSVSVWRAFSGNNSGECLLVARFEGAGAAERLLAELLPGFVPGEPYAAPWTELFEREHVRCAASSDAQTPDEMLAVGKAFFARTVQAPGDAFPELRALAWRRGGEVIAGGIHLHQEAIAIAAIRAADEHDVMKLSSQAAALRCPRLAHGSTLLLALAAGQCRGVEEGAPVLPSMRDAFAEVAGERPYAMELVFEPVDDRTLLEIAQRLGVSLSDRPRILLSFWAYGRDAQMREEAERFVAGLSGDAHLHAVTRADTLVLVEDVVRKGRLATRGHAAGASVVSLSGDVLDIRGILWSRQPPPRKGVKAERPASLDPAVVRSELESRLRRDLGPGPFDVLECTKRWGDRIAVTVRTSRVAEALVSLAGFVREHELESSLGVRDINPVERAVRRLLADLNRL